MKHIFTLLLAFCVAGCAVPQPPAETPYRQPWTVYKTRADIVPQVFPLPLADMQHTSEN